MFFYALTIFILVASFVRLRKTHPLIERPYRIPLTSWRLVLYVAAPPCACALVLLVFSTALTWVIALTVILITFVAWRPVQRARNRRLGFMRDRLSHLERPIVFEGHRNVALRGPFANV